MKKFLTNFTLFSMIFILLQGASSSKRIATDVKSEIARTREFDGMGINIKKQAEYRVSNFSIILLPDTQYYTTKPNNADNPYFHQTEWIVNNEDGLNIKFVIHLGDMTDANTTSQWEVADDAHYTLDKTNIPYGVIPGNHDYTHSEGCLVRGPANFNSNFGVSRFSGKPYYGGHYGSGNENNYCLFEEGYLKFLILNLEFAPDKDVLCWANDLIAYFKDRRVIIVTHCYKTHNEAYSPCAEAYNVAGSEGVTIWEELASRHSSVFMVLCGHVHDSEYAAKLGNTGNVVYEVLTDYQMEEPCAAEPCDNHCGGSERLGNGWLRVMEFRPGESRIYVYSVSVEDGNPEYFVGGEPWFYCVQYYNENPASADHAFVLDYNMKGGMQPYQYNDKGTRRFNDMEVNSVTDGQQLDPGVAMSDGYFAAVFEDDRDGNGIYNIYARGFMPDGCENFPEFRVNSITAGQQVNPEIAMDEDGDFVVVWQDDNNNNDYYEILARGFDANGDEIIPEFTVNSVSSGQQLNPDISMTPGGNFVVVWEDDQDKNGFYQIYARGFRADGVELFHDITVNSVSSGQQYDPAVEVTQSGNFVVTWEDDQDENGSYQILARGFKANGTELFHDITVNSVSSGQQRNPDIAIDMNGNFAVVWEDDQDNNNYYNIYVRGFYANGNERFHDRIVNSVSAGQQFNPAIAMSDNGDFVVTWEDDQDENSWYQIYSRGFDINGIERFHDRAVNKESNGQQYLPAITMDDSGNFVAAWEDDMNKNTSYNILARGLDASGN